MREAEIEILKKIIENKLNYEWAECKAMHSEYPTPDLKDYVFKPKNFEEVGTCDGLAVLGLVKRYKDGFILYI